MLKKIFKRKKKTLQEQYPEYDIGIESYGNPKILSWGHNVHLKIGAFCSFAPGVQILLGGNHRMDWVTTFPLYLSYKLPNFIPDKSSKQDGDITIGNDVWIGTEAIILSGVNIGNGAVIGARAVVTKNVPPYTIVAGNPATIINKRFDDKTIQQLQAIEWWKWDEILISKAAPLMLTKNIKYFIDFAKKL